MTDDTDRQLHCHEAMPGLRRILKCFNSFDDESKSREDYLSYFAMKPNTSAELVSLIVL